MARPNRTNLFPASINRSTRPPNPFADRGALRDRALFVGRQEQLQEIWSLLLSGNNVSIVGATGSGKTALLKVIAEEALTHLSNDFQVIWLPLQRKISQITAQREFAQALGGPSAKANDWRRLLQGKKILLLLDDLGQLDPTSKQELSLRLWLRQLSQDTSHATVQLVSTSLRRLSETFRGDNSPDYSPLHHTMGEPITLGPFIEIESRQFVVTRLTQTSVPAEEFFDLVKQPALPEDLRRACQKRYDSLS